MLLAGSRDRWSWEEDAFPPVAFCIRALVLDGLRVSPFDRHAEGDAELRKLGLDATLWHQWLNSILRQRATLSDLAKVPGPERERDSAFQAARAAGEILRKPGSFCPGPIQLQARLDQLWEAYAPIGETWKWRVSDVGKRVGSGRQQRALWQALTPFQERLPTFSVLLVDYPKPTVMPLPPGACLIAPAADPEEYRRQVVGAARGLATQR
jgi:hypothetical protein